MPVSFAAGPPKRAARPRAKAQVEDVGGGWVLRESRVPALGKSAARAFARAVRSAVVKQDGQEGPWAVRGEVPLEEESSACGCTTAVMRGVKMHLPEKLMGGNWLELHHAASGFHLGWDPLSALQCWAREALEALDTKRGGGTVWTGWAFDAEQLEQAWRDSAWSDSTSYTRREEWDWSFRTTYEGTVVRDAAAVGECERKVALRCQHGLIRAAFTKPAATTGAAASPGNTAETTPAAAAAAAAAETAVDWSEGNDADFAAPWDVAAAKEGGGATDGTQGGAVDGAAGGGRTTTTTTTTTRSRRNGRCCSRSRSSSTRIGCPSWASRSCSSASAATNAAGRCGCDGGSASTHASSRSAACRTHACAPPPTACFR